MSNEIETKAVPRTVIIDRRLGTGPRPQLPPEIDNDDEEWRADPFLRYAHEMGEDWT
jgi:hypothetical protein